MDITDIIIKVTADTNQAIGQFKGLTVVLQNIQKQATRSAEEIKKATISNFKGMRAIPKALLKTGEIPNVNAELKALGSQTITTGNAQDYLGGAIKRATANLSTELKSVQKVSEAAKNSSIKFAGWAMSIMFFGMAMQKTFDTLWKNGSKTFQDISHSVEGTTTGFDMLEGSTKYFQYAIGEALSPVVAMMAPIIDKITDWVLENEGLAGSFITTGIVLGGIFAAGGAGVLALNGFIELASKIGLAKINADGLVSMNWDKIATGIQKIAGVAAIAISIKLADDAVKQWESGDLFTASLKGVASASYVAAGYFLLKGSSGLGLIMASVGFVIDKTAEGTLFSSITRTIGVVSSLFLAAADWIGQNFSYVFAKVVRDRLVSMFDSIPGGRAIIDALIPEFDAPASFGSMFSDYYTEALILGQELDAQVNRVNKSYNEQADTIVRVKELMRGYGNLLSDSEIAQIIESKNSMSQIQRLLNYDAQQGNILTDQQEARLLSENKERTGHYFTVQNLNVTTNDIEELLNSIKRLSSGY